MDGLFEHLKPWNMFGAVDISLWHLDDDPPFGLSPARDCPVANYVLRQARPILKFFIFDDCGLAVDVQAYRGVKGTAKPHADVRILRDVAEAVQHTVPTIFEEHRPFFMQDHSPLNPQPSPAA